ncbi:hypothetical protein IEE94_11090 [Yimella sp. cx-573]|nr:hypothetical protein [Yimella sp. cx-573]
MPIKTIQQRHAELGRIRLGEKKTSANGKTFPSKLDRFRFTSPSKRHVEALAELYGGTPKPWDNNGRKEFEVITDATTIPVVVVRGGLSQWLETWTGGGCVHRCDGEVNVLTGEMCDPGDRNHTEAKPTTRLSVMLPQLEAIGVWRMESHGWNAAAELPGVANLAQMVGELVPANLTLHERVAIKDGKTSRFVVPGLDLEVGMARVVELANAHAQGIAAPAATGAPQIAAPSIDFMEAAREATSPDELRQIWRSAGEHNALTDELKSLIQSRVTEFEQPPTVDRSAQTYTPADFESGETLDEHLANNPGDVDDAWNKLVTAAGEQNIGTSNLRSMLEQEYAAPVADLTAEQLLAFIPKVAA